MRLLKDAPDKFTSETAKTIGKSETFVKEHLQLNDIKPELQKKVRDNQINKSQALAVHRKEKKIEKLKEEVKEIRKRIFINLLFVVIAPVSSSVPGQRYIFF